MVQRIFPPWGIDASKREIVEIETNMPFSLERYVDGGRSKRVVFVPPIINHPWILDMRPEISIIRRFCERSFDVYMIRWDCDDTGDLGFYEMISFITAVMERIGRASIFGYCTGGIISLLFASCCPKLTNSLSLLATPVDFSGSDVRILWGRYFDVRSLRRLFKNVPGETVNAIGAALLYYHLPQFLAEKEFIEEITSPEVIVDYWRRLRWIVDTPLIPGKAYEEFICGCYKANSLVRNEMKINGHRVDLKNIDIPILNIMAAFDHIVPMNAARRLGDVASSSQYEEIIFPSTHVGLSVSEKAHNELWPRVTAWVDENHLR